MKRLTLMLFSTALLFGAEPTAKPKPKKAAATSAAAAKPTYSRETLDRLRASLEAQLAVHDEAENAMRAPTESEAAALAPQASGTEAKAVTLKNGGTAIHAGRDNMEFLVATINPDGTVSMAHQSAGTGNAKKTEVKHVQ